MALFPEENSHTVASQDCRVYSVFDGIAILTDSSNPRRYWSILKCDLEAKGYVEMNTQSVQMKMEAPDEKMHLTAEVSRAYAQRQGTSEGLQRIG